MSTFVIGALEMHIMMMMTSKRLFQTPFRVHVSRYDAAMCDL